MDTTGKYEIISQPSNAPFRASFYMIHKYIVLFQETATYSFFVWLFESFYYMVHRHFFNLKFQLLTFSETLGRSVRYFEDKIKLERFINRFKHK